MAWQVRHIVASAYANNDLGSYVVDLPDFPIYRGNDDISPVVHFFNFNITQNCPYTLSIGDQVHIIGPTTSQYFEIKKVKTEKTNRTINVYVEHRLMNLKNYYLTEVELDAVITVTTDENKYCPDDNRYLDPYVYENVQMLWVIERMFYRAGINNYLFSDNTKTAFTYSATNYQFQHICLDYKMLYAINQGLSQTKEPASYISFWDFIQFCCAFWGFTFYEYNGDIIMLAKESLTDVEVNIGYGDNYLLAYEETESENKNVIALCDIYWSSHINHYYTGYGSDVVCGTNLNTDTDNQTTFNWFSNLRFLIRDTAGADGDILGAVWVDFFTNYSGVTNKMIEQSIENDYVEKYYELALNNELLAAKYYANEVTINIPAQILKVRLKDFS